MPNSKPHSDCFLRVWETLVNKKGRFQPSSLESPFTYSYGFGGFTIRRKQV